MRTDRLYYRDSYLSEFSARVLDLSTVQGKTGLVLDRTAFHPEGGGQPSDTGRLAGTPVVSVLEMDGQVVHLVQGTVPQGEIRGQVDWERRFDHMQQHSGQHLLSQAFVRLLDADTVSFHMGAETSTIDIATSSLTSDQVELVETLASRVIFESRPILVHLLDPSELPRFELRKGTDRTEQVRVVEVQGFDSIPCGGTHCRSTGEIGLIKVVGWERRGGNVRVEFLCGGRAILDYRAKNEVIGKLAATLSVRDSEVRDTVERLLRENLEARRRADRLEDRLLDYRAEEMARRALPIGQASVVTAVLGDCTPDNLKHLATRLVAAPGKVALLAASSDRAHVVFARSDDLQFDAAALLRQVCGALGGRGGGRPNLAQGGIPEPHKAGMALDEALEKLRLLLAV